MMNPPLLFDWLAGNSPTHAACVECGAGAGEPSAYLSKTFESAVAIDTSPIAVATARRHGGSVVRGSSTALPFADDSVDLIFSVQALHCFSVEAHTDEAARVLRPGGVFAALCWGEVILPQKVGPAYAPTLRSLEPYWEATRGFVLSGYEGVTFPGVPLSMPHCALTRHYTLESLDHEIAGWSAFRKAAKSGAEIAEPDLSLLALAENGTFPVAWPLHGVAFRKPAE